MIFGIVVVIFVIVCIFLILLVLIQSDKGGGISGAIGGGLAGASSLLGAQDTANILTRGTTIFASSYLILCILLSLFLSRTTISQQHKSELKKRAEAQSYSPASVLQGGGLPLKEEEGGASTPDKGEQAPILPIEE